MPHAENSTTTMSSSKPTVNGDGSHSQTISHFTSYPLVSELLNTYQSNSLGAQSISTFNSLYQTFVDPVKPYLQTPYSFVSPYLAKADSLGDSSLSTIDSHFPAIKDTDFEKLKGTAYDVASFPFKVAGSSKDYVFQTYDDEYKKTSGGGLVKTGKATVSTELRIVAEAMHAVADFLGPKKDQLQAEFEKAKEYGSNKAQQAQKYTQDKTSQAKSQADSTAKDAKSQVNSTADQAKSQANSTAEQAKSKTNSK